MISQHYWLIETIIHILRACSYCTDERSHQILLVSSSESYSSGTITFSQFFTNDLKNSRTAATQSFWIRSSLVLISSNWMFEHKKWKRLIDIAPMKILCPHLGEKHVIISWNVQLRSPRIYRAQWMHLSLFHWFQ